MKTLSSLSKKLNTVIRHQEAVRFIKYSAVGLLSYLLIFAGQVFLIEVVGIQPLISNIIVYAIAYTVMFFVQQQLIFKSDKSKKAAVLFLLHIVVFYTLNNLLFYLIHDLLGFSYVIAFFSNIAMLLPLRYASSKFIVFKPSQP